jgi:HEAT repeat protein
LSLPDHQVPDVLAADSSALPVLTELLQDPDWHVRSIAAECLWKLGPKARSSFTALLQAVEPVADLLHDELPKRDLFLGLYEDDRTEFCRFAAAAMYRIDSEAAERAGIPRLPFGRPVVDW